VLYILWLCIGRKSDKSWVMINKSIKLCFGSLHLFFNIFFSESFSLWPHKISQIIILNSAQNGDLAHFLEDGITFRD
jgi:hypothetical protein